jgi:hypothetical protein
MSTTIAYVVCILWGVLIGMLLERAIIYMWPAIAGYTYPETKKAVRQRDRELDKRASYYVALGMRAEDAILKATNELTEEVRDFLGLASEDRQREVEWKAVNTFTKVPSKSTYTKLLGPR